MKVLLLAGTGDARRIAEGLQALEVEAIASLAGATRQPKKLACETRIGGFGGAQGFRSYLHDAGIQAVVDATHPYAVTMANRAAEICRAAQVPHLRVLRPAWQPVPGDLWTEVANEADVAAHVAEKANVFLATGRQTLAGFANLTGRRLYCRQIDPPEQPFPFANGEFLIGRPPFSVEDEITLFRRLQIDVLVVKNSGGQASRTKLDAARHLGIRVLLIRRPNPPDCQIAETVSGALDWVRAQAAAHG